MLHFEGLKTVQQGIVIGVGNFGLVQNIVLILVMMKLFAKLLD